jgi:hypothetical protein
VERVFEWCGETTTLYVSLDFLAGTGQNVILEVVLEDEIIANLLVYSPSELIRVDSPKLSTPGVGLVRLASASAEMPTMITNSRLRRLDTVIRVFGPMVSPRELTVANIARRFVHFVRKRVRRPTSR